MEGNPSFDHVRNENASVDLKKPLVNNPEINSSEEYKDPELKNKTWCSYMEREFRASRNMMEKQSGTHTEAPADVIGEETSKKQLQPDQFME
ncbi:MAG TPA: hypothetical protein PLY36_13920 [Spirochaetota bacterium]|nr:hypothetical protein [Spirochaetota bacterium]